ncbi:MBL fold metallo-hydrolase [Methanimicrococcus stummii]|uniref:MBL fold metallo-hydrolase n=1 Tax=Methanimicrococcus stummii TaxID=3028294 RepID=UPI00292FF736|nr:MBL fold metallo-hydrolase [Methanimicrococcus sp. Es2]
MYSKELAELGFVIFRRQNENGGIKPHLFIRFKSKEGRLLTFAVDTTRIPSSQSPPDAYLITHAHSDHYGKSAMLSESSYCSEETAHALEIRYEKTYKGQTFQNGSCFSICGVEIQTFDVFHAPGSSAFYFENALGNSILITGDVKDARFLPKCDILLTEASYGDPADLSCYFKDDIGGLHQAVLSHIGERRIAFGAYEFGKSQKAVSILRGMGYNGPIAMNKKTLSLTEKFVDGAGNLIDLNGGGLNPEVDSESEAALCHEIKTPAQICDENDCRICIVPIGDLYSFGADTRKYVLTCRADYPFENIRLSDHLDVDGLTQMVRDISPKLTVIYHPNKSPRTDRFAQHLEKNGFKAFSINQIQNLVGNEKQLKSE